MTPTIPYHAIFVQLLLSTGRLYNYGRLKTKENFKFLALKVVAVTLRS